MMRPIINLILCTFIGSGIIFAQDTVSSPKKLDMDGFRGVVAEVDMGYVSGQPDEQAFGKMKDMGVTTVVNLRTDGEMANRAYVPFDEKKVLDSLGLEYVHIPLGGDDTPYTREALTKFAAAVDHAGGKVLLHCTVAWRASHMWAAYLIEYKGMAPAEAIRNAKGINFGDLPLEGLMGKKMKVTFE